MVFDKGIPLEHLNDSYFPLIRHIDEATSPAYLFGSWSDMSRRGI